MGQLDHATGWTSPTAGSTDYFNACQADLNSVGVPTNLLGHQPAHTGDGYAGILCFNGPDNTGLADGHEYMCHPLATPLVPGEAYVVEFFVSLADVSAYAVNDIGALFSVQPPHRTDMLTITATPQITNTALTLLSDTSGWMRIQGCFTADSAYAHITIGNFHPGATTAYASMPPNGSGVWFGYYFIDDVSVRHVPRPGLGPDLMLCEATTLHVQTLFRARTTAGPRAPRARPSRWVVPPAPIACSCWMRHVRLPTPLWYGPARRSPSHYPRTPRWTSA